MIKGYKSKKWYIPKIKEYLKEHGIYTLAEYRQHVKEVNPDCIPPIAYQKYLPERKKVYKRRRFTRAEKTERRERMAVKRAEKRKLEALIILGIAKDKKLPYNVFHFIIVKDGPIALRHEVEKDDLELLASFTWNKKKAEEINGIIANSSESYRGERMIRVAQNIRKMIWDLSAILN